MTATAIIRTLAYADIFSYPLTTEEIHHWLISPKKISVSSINSALSVLSKKRSRIEKVGNYYTLAGRSKLVSLRRQRHLFSKTKTREAKRVGEWLKIIPTISLVAITGALSMQNADKYDDIDLLVVTTPHTLWLTRLFVVPYVSLIAKRRHPPPQNKKELANAICLNLWLDEAELRITTHNLYTAHEVAQVKTLWSRGEAKDKLLIHNSWVKHFLANIKIPPKPTKEKSPTLSLIVNKANQLAFNLQRLYMKSRLTREIVTLHAAFFHPKNTNRKVIKLYHRRLHQLNLRP